MLGISKLIIHNDRKHSSFAITQVKYSLTSYVLKLRRESRGYIAQESNCGLKETLIII